MSGTIAQLGIEVNSGDAVQAATDLDKLTQAGVKAEAAAGGVADGFSKAGASAAALAQAESKLAESTEDAKARLLAMAKASLEASQYNQNLTVSVNGTSAALDGSKAAATDWAAYQKTINANAERMRENEHSPLWASKFSYSSAFSRSDRTRSRWKTSQAFCRGLL